MKIKKGVSLAGRIGLAVFGLLLAFSIVTTYESMANAEPNTPDTTAHWLNRGWIEYKGVYFFDSNPGDDYIHYASTPNSPDFPNCTIDITFDAHLPSTAVRGYDYLRKVANNKFFYGDAAYSTTAKYRVPNGNKNADGSINCNLDNPQDTTTSSITVTQVSNRRITFIKKGDSYYNYLNGQEFKPTAMNGLYRRVDGAEPCKDLLYIHPVTASGDNGIGASPFKHGQTYSDTGIAGLYGVKNDNGARQAETYGSIYGNHKSCFIENEKPDHNDQYAMLANSGDAREDVEDLIAYGFDGSGHIEISNLSDDDTYITFTGTAAENAPQDANGGIIPAPGTAPNNAPSCKGGGLGWVLCPIANGIKALSELIEKALAYMLKVNPLPIDTTSNIYKVWENIRNIADVLFVIAFMIVIFSQATSIGLSNYGIKTLLPRLLVVAVLANVSYYLCSFVIDAFNIMGVGIDSLFSVLNGGTATPSFSNGAGFIAIASISGVIAATLTTGLIVEIFPLLITAILAAVVTFIVLVARQGLLILLVVASPIILVGYILPGTRQLASKATSLFTTLLAMYPLIVGLFGAVGLATAILTSVSSGSSIIDMFKQFIALIFQIVIGFSVIFMFKWALVAKTALGKFASNLNNGGLAKGLVGRAKQRAENTGFYQRRELARQFRQQEYKRSGQESFATAVGSSGRWRRKAGGRLNSDGQRRAGTFGAAKLRALEEDETKNSASLISAANISGDELVQLAAGATITRNGVTVSGADRSVQRAAMRQVIATQYAGGIRQMVTGTSSTGQAITVDQEMLRTEINAQYSSAKAAGAGFVTTTRRDAAGNVTEQGVLDTYGPVSVPTLQEATARGFLTLTGEKLLGQDIIQADDARAGFASLDATQQQQLASQILAAFRDETALKAAKPGTIRHLRTIVQQAGRGADIPPDIQTF